MWDAVKFVGGTIWGAIKAPFTWIHDAGVGLFSGGTWGAMAGIGLAAVGPFAVPFIQAMVPGLENVGWLTQASNYMASSSFVERLAFLGLGGAAAGAAAGATAGTASSLAHTLSANTQTAINPETNQPEHDANAVGQKIGMTAGTIVVALGAGLLAAGAAKRAGLIGGDEADKAEGNTVVDAREKDVNVKEK